MIVLFYYVHIVPATIVIICREAHPMIKESDIFYWTTKEMPWLHGHVKLLETE